jgi:hypothetical protein
LDKVATLHSLNSKIRGSSWDADSVEALVAVQPEPEAILDAAERPFGFYGSRVPITEETKEGAMEALHFKRPAAPPSRAYSIHYLFQEARFWRGRMRAPIPARC